MSFITKPLFSRQYLMRVLYWMKNPLERGTCVEISGLAPEAVKTFAEWPEDQPLYFVGHQCRYPLYMPWIKNHLSLGKSLVLWPSSHDCDLRDYNLLFQTMFIEDEQHRVVWSGAIEPQDQGRQIEFEGCVCDIESSWSRFVFLSITDGLLYFGPTP